MIIEPGDPAQARALLTAHHALMVSLFPAESNHHLELGSLRAPNIRFFLATDPEVLGCAALQVMDGYGEVKSMHVAEAARGRGLGRALLQKLEDQARAEGLPLLRLETGARLAEAHALYRAAGFTECGAFGDYPADDPHSLYMEKRL